MSVAILHEIVADKMLDMVLCACGSGLRRVRCCDADPAALPEGPSVEILASMGVDATKLYNEKKHGEAAALAIKLLDLAPNNRAALRVLFEVRKAENKHPAAEILARRLAELPAENNAHAAAANLQLAQLLVGQGKHNEAEPAARRTLKLSPRDATAHHVMGVILTETGRLAAGETHYRRALTLLEREDGMVLANLAWNLRQQGRLDEAAGIYERALLIRPDNPRGVGGFAQVEAGRGRLPRAAAMLDEALVTWPKDRTLRLLRALTDLQMGRADEVLARLDGPPEQLMPAELSARGLALARKNLAADATAIFALAKRMQRERYGQKYEPEVLAKTAEAYKTWFTADRLGALPRATPAAGPQPVFMLGFARSGGSLLEQMLAKTAGFSAADQAVPVADLVEMVPRLTGLRAHGAEAAYPDALSDTLIGDGQEVPNQLRRQYAAGLAAAGLVTPETQFVTSRAAANHWHLGLIKLLFPDTPVIHVIRHPYDVILSNFSQDRRLEGNCGVSLLALARHYDFTMSLIKHFRGQLTLRYLPVRYEDLVTDPAGTLDDVLAFIGADPASRPGEYSLRANELLAGAIVPGHAVTQEPIHQRGLYRHHAYQAVLPNLFSEVRPILEPWIVELGYGEAN